MGITRFLHEETGAITVDYVVLTAAAAFLGLGAISLLASPTEDRAERFNTQTEVWRKGVNARANYEAFHEGTFNAVFGLIGTLSPEERAQFNAFTNEFVNRENFDQYHPAWQQYFVDINAAFESHYAENDLDRPDDTNYDWNTFVSTWNSNGLGGNVQNYVN